MKQLLSPVEERMIREFGGELHEAYGIDDLWPPPCGVREPAPDTPPSLPERASLDLAGNQEFSSNEAQHFALRFGDFTMRALDRSPRSSQELLV